MRSEAYFSGVQHAGARGITISCLFDASRKRVYTSRGARLGHISAIFQALGDDSGRRRAAPRRKNAGALLGDEAAEYNER